MSETIALTTPAQINMWVLLSRRHQLQMQLKGLKTPGLVKWCQDNIPGAGRTAKSCVVPVEYAISQAGGEVDYKLVNVHAMVHADNGVYFIDHGIWNNMDELHAGDKEVVKAYFEGRAELVITDEPVRPAANYTIFRGA